MAELKTKATRASVPAFLNAIPDRQQRADAKAVAAMMAAVTKTRPKMWGTSIVGYGSQQYRYASGREGDWFQMGFSPRKDALTLYVSGGLGPHADLLARLGEHRTGRACLYIKRLSDVDPAVLKRLLARALKTPLPGA